MRTTVTLDKDVERLLREEMHRTRRSFKETLNAAVRAGLTGGARRASARRRRFTVNARPMGLKAGIDPARFNQLADQLEIDATVQTLRGERLRP
jgi:hypothetical protein